MERNTGVSIDSVRSEACSDLESNVPANDQSSTSTKANNNNPWREVLKLGFASLGAIYGDIGTSPLYVLTSIKYKTSPPSKDDIMGGISVIFYLLTIIVVFKYVFIVLFLGPNEGEGGQIAIYTKIARSLKLVPRGVASSKEDEFEMITRQKTSSSYRSTNSLFFKSHDFKKNPILLKIISKVIICCCFIGCALVISDGLLTPTTSVLSAIEGIKVANPSFDNVLAISEVILVVLFFIQQFGSQKLSFTFAPVIFIWFICLFITGLYNIITYEPGIFRCLSPYYAIKLLKRGGIDVFSGAMLAITGTEAMFADIGHFGRLPVQITLSCFVYPCLVICYLGQGAYALHHPDALSSLFYYSIPGKLNGGIYWVMFILATLSTLIASQALILSVFSITSQLINLGCLPSFKIVRTSKDYFGKVYIPTINWLLMIGVCLTTAGFKTSNAVTAAYGLGISMDFFVTSILISICMVYVYNMNFIVPILFTLFFMPLEATLIVANFKKFVHGAWFPFLITCIGSILLAFWRWAQTKKVNQEFRSRIRVDDLFPSFKLAGQDVVDLNNRHPEIENNVQEAKPAAETSESDKLLVNRKGITSEVDRNGSIALIYSKSYIHTLSSPNTVPQVYNRMIQSYSTIPSIVIFCGIKVVTIPEVPAEEKIIFGAMKIPNHFRCIIRFGFMEEVLIDDSMKKLILETVGGMTNPGLSTDPNEVSRPVVHIFENDLIRSHEYNGEDDKKKNFFIRAMRKTRQFLINNVFSPVSFMLEANGHFLKVGDEDEEAITKVYIGGIARV